MRSAIRLFVPVACVAMGLGLVVSGCGKQAEVESIPPNSPAAYSKDASFNARLDAMAREQKAIVAERQPLLARLKKISSGGSVRQENVAEFKDLQKRVAALNAKYESIRRRQLAAMREKMTPAGARGTPAAK